MKKIFLIGAILCCLFSNLNAQSADTSKAGNGDTKSSVSSAKKEYLPSLEFVPICEIVGVSGCDCLDDLIFQYCTDIAFANIRRRYKSELDYYERILRKTPHWSSPELGKIVWVVRYGNDMVAEDEPSEELQLIETEDER